MADYVAHYKSPGGESPVSGVFEFASVHRRGTRQNLHDARMHMLEAYGAEAVAWIIDSIEPKRSGDERGDGQMQLDFREPTAPKRKRVQRGFR